MTNVLLNSPIGKRHANKNNFFHILQGIHSLYNISLLEIVMEPFYSGDDSTIHCSKKNSGGGCPGFQLFGSLFLHQCPHWQCNHYDARERANL